LFVLVKCERQIKFILLVWTFVFALQHGALSHATEIAGDWQAEDHAGKRLFYAFETDHTFFIESETSWFQGTYNMDPEAIPGLLDLYVQDGSNGEDVGKTITYVYDIHDHLLTLSRTDPGGNEPPIMLASVNQAGSSAFIGVNTDPPHENDKDDNDTNWYVYASCFVMSVMSGSPPSESSPAP
jgi:hypothetical protein